MSDPFQYHARGTNDAGRVGTPITSGNDSTDLADGVCRAFYVSKDATVKIKDADGNIQTIPVGAFQVVPIAVVRLYSTDTSLNSGTFVPIR